MLSVLSFAVIPMVVFVGLAALPRGRPALIGIVGAAALAILVTVAMLLFDTTGMGAAIAMLSGSAVALAGVAQALRQALGPGRPAWLYPLIVLSALLLSGLPLLQSLGA